MIKARSVSCTKMVSIRLMLYYSMYLGTHWVDRPFSATATRSNKYQSHNSSHLMKRKFLVSKSPILWDAYLRCFNAESLQVGGRVESWLAIFNFPPHCSYNLSVSLPFLHSCLRRWGSHRMWRCDARNATLVKRKWWDLRRSWKLFWSD